MKSRVDLDAVLVDILGSEFVYFQPPNGTKIKYPCIVYELSQIRKRMAENKAYTVLKSYTVTFIHKDPDSPITDKILKLPYCRFDRRFVTDNLYHDVFTLYY